jgi:hypothetical protein
MRNAPIIAALAVLLLASPTASAGTFGGFSKNETVYLNGSHQVCKPIPLAKLGTSSSAGPKCSSADAQAVARHQFKRLPAQRGVTADFRAVASGMSLIIVNARTNAKVVSWSAGDPISRVINVYATKAKDLIAVEYETRMGGSASTDVVAFRLPTGSRPNTTTTTTTTNTNTNTQPGTKLDAAQRKQYAKLMKQAKRWQRRGRRGRTKAIALYRKALALDSNLPEPRFRIAVILAKGKKTSQTLAELKLLAASKHPRAIVWLVEARSNRAFRKLYANKIFRAVVGLDRKSSQATTAYERVAGFGGKWEQAGQVCEKAWVNLNLRRLPKQTFRLRIKSRCRGYADTTRLGGKWKAVGRAQLNLVLPNKGAKDQTVVCRLFQCTDGSGEDCMRCPIARDIILNLRVVRR